MSRPIAIIGGTGKEGLGLAWRWVRAGETVVIGSRDAKRAQEAAAKIKQRAGPSANVSGDTNAATCAACDLIVLTVPFEGHAELLNQLKLVVEIPLEPENDLIVVSKAAKRVVPLAKIALHFFQLA